MKEKWTMYRKQLKVLEKWLKSSNRKPMILRGARQVGKSTLVNLFANRVGSPLAVINLERHLALETLFATNDPAQILEQLSFLPEAQMLQTNDCILFLDEIQATPKAIPCLRYFFEDLPSQPVLAAGSLLEFALETQTSSMPVGRINYLHMGPMTFTEFLEAMGETKLKQALKEYQFGASISPLVHERFMALLRRYLFIGGMPEAVKAFAETQSIQEVNEVHRSILETYREDLPKYIGGRNITRMLHVLNFSASTIGKKVKYSAFSADDTSKTIKQDIELLCLARLLTKVYHSDANGSPVQAEINHKKYKLLFLDVGLMNSLLGANWRSLSQTLDDTLINEGQIAEQFIGQHLVELLNNTTNRQPTYWLKDGKAKNAEVDFILGLHGNIIPIEVKAGASGALRSLHEFMKIKQSPLALRFDANPPSQQEVSINIRGEHLSYPMVSLPLYLVGKLEDEDFVTTALQWAKRDNPNQ